MVEIRTTPPSTTANNQDVFIWALYVLGGADREIDVENIYLKAFELAPARLGWRTHPEIPNYKTASKAMQGVEAKTHVGLVLWINQYARKLTAEGVQWVETYKMIFEKNYAAGPVAAASTNAHEKRRKSLIETRAWQIWVQSGTLDLFKLSEALVCSPGSPVSIWKSRAEEISRAGRVLQDERLVDFAASLAKFIELEIDKK